MNDAAGIAELRRTVQLQEQLAELRRARPSCFFRPTPKQYEFIQLPDAVYQDPKAWMEKHVFLLMGANGVGKTKIASEIVTNLALGPQSPFFRNTFFENFPRPCMLRLTSTQKALDEGLLRELRDMLRSHLAPGYPKKGTHTYEAYWRTALRSTSSPEGMSRTGGSEFDVLTWQMGITQHAGAFRHGQVFDEPGPEPIFDEDMSRLRRGGAAFWPMTPVDSKGGISREIMWVHEKIMAHEEGNNRFWHVTNADMEDSCEEHARESVEIDGERFELAGRVPHHVIASEYDRLKDNPAQLQARFHGRFALELGVVIKEWDDERNIMDPPDDIGSTWPRYCALDTHFAKPHVFHYGVQTPHLEFWVICEIVHQGLIREVAEKIRQVFMVYGMPQLALVDPLSRTENPVTGKSMFTELADHGVAFTVAGPEKSDKAMGINKVREMVKGVDGRPMWRVSRNCPFMISQAKRWMNDPKTFQPMKEHDDSWENAYRIALHLPTMAAHTVTQYQDVLNQGAGSSLTI